MIWLVRDCFIFILLDDRKMLYRFRNLWININSCGKCQPLSLQILPQFLPSSLSGPSLYLVCLWLFIQTFQLLSVLYFEVFRLAYFSVYNVFVQKYLICLINPFAEFSIAGVIFIISESILSLSFKSLTLYFMFHIFWKYCQFCIWSILNCGSYYFNIWKLKSSISAQISAQFYSRRHVSLDIFWVLTMCILLTKVFFN